MVYLFLKTNKVQSFIFKLPKLKTMLGANSLLGEFFVKELPKLREKYDVPEEWTNYISSIEINEKWETDDLKANFEKGIISSAGGHFDSLFTTSEEAKEFALSAFNRGKEIIPGVSLSIRCIECDFEEIKTLDDFKDKGTETLCKEPSDIFIDNPYFYPSDDGINPQLVKSKNESQFSKHIKKQGEDFYSRKTSDFLSTFLKETNKADNMPVDFESLAKASIIPSNNKMAVIAIDGNAMGDCFKDKRELLKLKPMFETLVEYEKFWFSRREAYRKALEASCKIHDNHKYQVLMLGGDDLLIISVPEIAFDIVDKFCTALSNTTISAGIAFTKYTYPFSQAHALAESLLSSAKVKSRIWNVDDSIEYVNTIDWHVHFPSGSEDIETIREINYLNKYEDTIEILTQRPCRIKTAMKIWEQSKNEHNLATNEKDAAGRNKYKQLRTILKTGKANTELLSKYLNFPSNLIEYHSLGDNILLNTALDIIELMDFCKVKSGGQNETH